MESISSAIVPARDGFGPFIIGAYRVLRQEDGLIREFQGHQTVWSSVHFFIVCFSHSIRAIIRGARVGACVNGDHFLPFRDMIKRDDRNWAVKFVTVRHVIMA